MYVPLLKLVPRWYYSWSYSRAVLTTLAIPPSLNCPSGSTIVESRTLSILLSRWRSQHSPCLVLQWYLHACVFHSATAVYLSYIHTQLVHCLHEYQTGSFVKLSFKGQYYDAVHMDFSEIIEETINHSYHGEKLKKLLRRIGKEGR